MLETASRGTTPAEKHSDASCKRLLLVYPVETTFVRNDIELLRRVTRVTTYHFRGPRSYAGLLARLFSTDIVYCWFALGFAAFAAVLSRILGRRVIVVAGGWDVVAMPEIGYGRLVTMWGRFVARTTFFFAHEILAFSDWSAHQIRRLSRRARIRRVYLSVDPAAFVPGPKERVVVCIANVSRENIVRKGLRTFVQAASYLKEVQFFLVGRWLDDSAAELTSIAPPNVKVTGRLPDRDLQSLLARAKVYCQPSYTEGFGVAIAEAMASGCVPVVTRVGAIPEVVGETGIFADYGNPSGLAEAIELAFESDAGPAARMRAVRMFTPGGRLAQLELALMGSDDSGSEGGH